MSPQQFVEQLHENYHLYHHHFGTLSSDQIQKKMNSGTWSVAENIEHVIKVNSTYVPVFNSIQNGTYSRPFMSRLPLATKKFGAMILKAVSRNREKKMKTFPIWEPTQSRFENPLSQLLENHQTLASLVLNIGKIGKNGTVIASPASSIIVYSFEDALSIIIEHELRHLEQAKEFLSRLTS